MFSETERDCSRLESPPIAIRAGALRRRQSVQAAPHKVRLQPPRGVLVIGLVHLLVQECRSQPQQVEGTAVARGVTVDLRLRVDIDVAIIGDPERVQPHRRKDTLRSAVNLAHLCRREHPDTVKRLREE